MFASKIKDLKARVLFNKFEKQNLISKFVLINGLNNNNKFSSKFNYFPKENKFKFEKKSKIKLVRRCIFNNRNRGVSRSFGISRILLRELLQFGQIPGYSKAVW